MATSEKPTGVEVHDHHAYGEVKAGDTEHFWQWRTQGDYRLVVWSSEFPAAFDVWDQEEHLRISSDGTFPKYATVGAHFVTSTLMVKIPSSVRPGARYIVSVEPVGGEDPDLHAHNAFSRMPRYSRTPNPIEASGTESITLTFDPKAPLHPQFDVPYHILHIKGTPNQVVTLEAKAPFVVGAFARMKEATEGPVPLRVGQHHFYFPPSGEINMEVFPLRRDDTVPYQILLTRRELLATEYHQRFGPKPIASSGNYSPPPKPVATTAAIPPRDPKAPFTSESQETALKIQQRDLAECNEKCRPWIKICVDSCENFSSPRVCIADKCAETVAYCVSHYTACRDYCESNGCRDISVLVP